MPAFHDARRRPPRPTTWELRLTDGAFTAHARGRTFSVAAGAPEEADLVITAPDEVLHGLLARTLSPAKAVRTHAVTLAGDREALAVLLDLCVFPGPAAV